MKKGVVSTKHSLLLIGIITLTIILIIIFAFKGNFLENNKSLLNKVELRLKINNVEVLSEENVKASLTCDKGQENLEGIRFIFETQSDSETIDVNYSIEEGEEAEFTIKFEKINANNLVNVQIYPIMRLENGELSIGSIKDQYNRFYK